MEAELASFFLLPMSFISPVGVDHSGDDDQKYHSPLLAEAKMVNHEWGWIKALQSISSWKRTCVVHEKSIVPSRCKEIKMGCCAHDFFNREQKQKERIRRALLNSVRPYLRLSLKEAINHPFPGRLSPSSLSLFSFLLLPFLHFSFFSIKFLPPSIHLVAHTASHPELFTHQNKLEPCRPITARSLWTVSPQTQPQQHSTASPLDGATPIMWRASSSSSHPQTLITSVSTCGPWYQRRSLNPSLTGGHPSGVSIVLSAVRVSLSHFSITVNCSPLELSVPLSASDMTPRRKSGPVSRHRLCMVGPRMIGRTRRSISIMVESSPWYTCWRMLIVLLFGSGSLMRQRTSSSWPVSGRR